MLALTLALGLCTRGVMGLQRSPSVHGCGRCCRASAQTLRARLRPMLPAPRMAAPDDEEAAPRTGKSEVFGEMGAEEQAAFLRQLDDACAAAGVGQSARFRGLLDAMAEGDGTEWRVLSTGQIVQAAKHFPGLTAMPVWEPEDFDEEDQPFPWLAQLEACVPTIAAELHAVCNAELPPGYDPTPKPKPNPSRNHNPNPSPNPGTTSAPRTDGRWSGWGTPS